MQKALSKTNFFLIFGTVLEYFDYVLFMELSFFISKIFFPGNMMSYFYIFSVGYGARFVGVLMLSMIKRDLGKIMQYCIFTMAVSTLLISLLPCYHSVGLLATVSFIILRFIQSLSYSIEFPTAITIQAKQEDSHSKIGTVIASSTTGGVLANVCALLLLRVFSEAQILSFAWRIPFLVSGLIGLTLCRIRISNVSEQLDLSTYHLNTSHLFNNVEKIVQNTKILLFPCFLIVSYIYFPTFFRNHGYKNLYYIFKYKTIVLALSILFVTLAGKFMDKRQDRPIDLQLLQKLFIVAWSVSLILSLMHIFGVILLMLTTQVSIAFYFQLGLKNLLRNSSLALSTLIYNLSMFLASLLTLFLDYSISMLIIPLFLSLLFTLCYAQNGVDETDY
ncbi:MAG: hypothetical protein H6845_02095 [Alphaproteobacteria bacterium]|nr:MAG: hypothetical protein H6845_02095 [Alphaproteobacteria bacterium]